MSRALSIIGPIIALIGLAGLVISAMLDQVSIVVLLVFPVFVIMGPLGILSIIVLSIGIMMLLMGTLPKITDGLSDEVERHHSKGRRRAKLTPNEGLSLEGVVFLGPIPIIIGGHWLKRYGLTWSSMLLVGVLLFILLYIILYIIIIFNFT